MSLVSHAMARIAQASRILALEGVLDAFGHVSCRHPERSDRFLIPRRLAPALVTKDDIVELDLDGEPAPGFEDVPVFLERFIHGEIYRLRTDVGAVVHSHAPAVVPFTIVPGVRVRPACHMCGFLGGTPAAFDVADHAGPGSDLLIRDRELGRQLAAHLGKAAMVPMRAHGFTAVAREIEGAVYRAVYTTRNCEIDLSARSLGEPVYLTDEEAVACEATGGPQMNRAWNLWVQQLG